MSDLEHPASGHPKLPGPDAPKTSVAPDAPDVSTLGQIPSRAID